MIHTPETDPPETDKLARLIRQIDNDPSLTNPQRFRDRLDALDRLDAFLPDTGPVPPRLESQARDIRDRLEAANQELYAAIRAQIQRGERPADLLRWVADSPALEADTGPAHGFGYDHLDELVAGVLQLEPPQGELTHNDSEMVAYQPTPARHIFRLLALTELTAGDVLVDLGSGLGHIPILAAACTPALALGVELEPAYVDCARRCAQSLNLNRASFLAEDARAADLSDGTVFYLHTPFRGSILAAVLERLRCEASTRRIRVCTYGPCTAAVAQEGWLRAAAPPVAHRIALFTSLG